MKPPYYCISQAICGLCGFDLSNGEPACAIVEDAVCCDFEFQRFYAFDVAESNVRMHICLSGSCVRREKLTTGFHQACYKYQLAAVTPKLLAINRYNFMPFENELSQRFHYIRGALASNLHQAPFWPQNLPYELWLSIAGFLVPECAIHTAQAQTLACAKDENTTIDLAQSVYASYVKIYGQYYVKCLKNTPDTHAGETTCLVLPAQAEQDRKNVDMVIAQDHLGIRQVFFLPSKNCEEWCRNHSSIPDVWWKHVSSGDLPSTISFKTDGVKIRDIADIPSDGAESKTQVSWQVPVSTTPTIYQLFYPEASRPNCRGLRMRVFDCNSPDILGYVVASDGAKVLAVLTHRRGEMVDVSLHENVDSHFFWMYMPVEPDEYLTDICMRSAILFSRLEILGMTFTTSKGRTFVFGQYRHENNISLRRVVKLPPRPCRLYFNELDSLAEAYTVNRIAFENDDFDSFIATQDALPTLPCSISSRPNKMENDLWVYTSCSLVGVNEVHLCISDTVSHRPIIGMLLYYSDGHRECVGQIRLDLVTKHVLLNQGDKLYISGDRTEKHWAYVSEVTTQAPVDQGETPRLELEQTGTLEWWFSSWHNVLCYDGHRLH